MNKNYARLVVVAQFMEDKYNDPSASSITLDQAMLEFGDIEEKLELLQNLPWISDKAAMTITRIKEMLSVLHRELYKSPEKMENKGEVDREYGEDIY